jgi:hypothetical protein
MANAVKTSEVWLDGVKQYSVANASVSTALSAGAGSHRLTVQTIDTANVIAKQTINVNMTVTAPGGGTACPALATIPSENICSPTNNSSLTSPFPVSATGHMANSVNTSEVWLDGVKQYSVANASVSTALSAGAGSHRLTVQTIDTANAIAKQTIYVTVPQSSSSCVPGTASPSVTICAPAPNASVTSPVAIVAASTDSAASVTNVFIWIDGVRKWTGTGSTVNTSLPLTTGTHRVVVQAKDSAGKYFQSAVYVTVH